MQVSVRVLLGCLLLAAVCLATFALAQEGDKTRQTALAKRKWMLGKAKEKEDGVISLDANQFNRYVLNSPRPYSVVVFFTASEEKFGCQPCIELRGLIGHMSQAFKSGLSENAKKAVFFVEVDYGAATANIFQVLQIQQVPQVVLVDPTKKNLQLTNFWESIGAEGKYLFDQSFSPRALAEWIAQKSGVPLPDGAGSMPSGGEGDGSNQIGGGPVSGAGFIVSLLIVGIPIFYVQRRNPVVYFIIATLAFFFCISGGMFNIIRGVPFAEVDRNGRTNYFSGGGQFQYGAEGYIMGGLQIVGGLIMVLMNTYGVKASDAMRRNILSVAFALALYLLFAKIRELYMIKMPGYNHGHVWSWVRLLE